MGISASVINIYFIYMGSVLSLGTLLLLIFGRSKRTSGTDVAVPSTSQRNEERLVPVGVNGEAAEPHNEAMPDPVKEEISRLNIAIHEIRTHRYRQRTAVKTARRPMTDEERRRDGDLYKLMERMKERVKSLESGAPLED